jgi:hypothetical protein
MVVCTPVIPVLEKLTQENLKFEASLSHIAKTLS